MEAVNVLLQCDGGGAEGLDTCGGSGHFGEVLVTEYVDLVQTGTGLIGSDCLL